MQSIRVSLLVTLLQLSRRVCPIWVGLDSVLRQFVAHCTGGRETSRCIKNARRAPAKNSTYLITEEEDGRRGGRDQLSLEGPYTNDIYNYGEHAK